jgi:prolyl oligopeptidase
MLTNKTFLTLVLSMSLVPQAFSAPPSTDEREFRYTVGGAVIGDPYLWLEGSDAPELEQPDSELDAQVSAWTDAQNAYTRGVLDGLEGRNAIEAELTELLSLDSYGIPNVAGDWLFYTLRRGDQAQPVLYATHTPSDETRALVDVNALDASGLLALDWYRPSPDGRYVAYGTYEAGDELTTAYVLETESGEMLPDRIGGRVDPVDWLDDSEHFVVRTLSDGQNPYSSARASRGRRSDSVRSVHRGRTRNDLGSISYRFPRRTLARHYLLHRDRLQRCLVLRSRCVAREW